MQTGVERLLEGWDTGPLERLETDLYRWSVGEQTSPLVIVSKAVKGFEFFKLDFELCCSDLSGTVMELLLGQRKSGPQQLQTSIDNLAVEVKQVALAKYKSDLQNCVCNFSSSAMQIIPSMIIQYQYQSSGIVCLTRTP